MEASLPYKEPTFITWLKEDWLLKLGGVLVLMGVLFFLSVTFTMLPPGGRIMVSYLLGSILMIFGFKYAKKEIIGGSSIHLVGAVVIIITTYVARQPEYNLFSPSFATLLMFLTSVVISLMSYAYNRKSLAHLGLFLAAAVPFLTGTAGQAFSSTLLYLGIVTLGVLFLAIITGWRTLVLLSLSVVSFYSVLKISGALGITFPTLLESYLLISFGIIFFITSLFSILRSKGETQIADGAIALLNAGYALLWIFTQVSREVSPIIIAFIALFYAIGFFLVYKITNVYTSFIVYAGVAFGLLTTSVIMELSGKSETIALVLMGAGFTFFTYYLSRDEYITKIVALFNILPIFYVFYSVFSVAQVISSGKGFSGAWSDLLIIGLAIAVYLSLYSYFINRSKDLSHISLGAAVLFIVTSIWQVLHLLLSDLFATSIALLIIGLGLTLFTYFISNNDEKSTKAVALFNVLPFFFALSSVADIGSNIHNTFSRQDLWKNWFVVAFAMATYLYTYYYFNNRIKSLHYFSLGAVLILTASSLWQFLHLIFGEGLGTFISVVLYTIIGLYALFKGTQESNDIKIKIARAWVAFVALRIIFIDAWQAGDTLLGVLICIVVGILLLSSTIMIKKIAENKLK